MILACDKLDKLGKLVYTVNNLTINKAKYYDSNTGTVSDSQGDITRNMETVTYTNSRNETVTLIGNRNFEQKILRNRIISATFLMMNPRINQSIAPIVVAPQTLLTPDTKEVFVDAASGGAWVNRTLQ